ncbi:hypothetical protein ACLKA6_005945 [Drosophila palustris]
MPHGAPKDSSVDGRIYNGVSADEFQFRYQVGLNFSSSSGEWWWCNGAIIARQYVLTAASCTNDAAFVIAIFGATTRAYPKLTSPKMGREYFIQHENYDPKTQANDIALFRLSFELPYNRFIDYVKLPPVASSYSTYAGQQAIATGWGTTSDGSTDVPYLLQYQTFTIASDEVCRNTFGSVIDKRDVLCTAPNPSSLCKGDSGAPLVLVNKPKLLVGIASFMSNNGCETGSSAGYTRVTSYLEWIKENSGVFY